MVTEAAAEPVQAASSPAELRYSASALSSNPPQADLAVTHRPQLGSKTSNVEVAQPGAALEELPDQLTHSSHADSCHMPAAPQRGTAQCSTAQQPQRTLQGPTAHSCSTTALEGSPHIVTAGSGASHADAADRQSSLIYADRRTLTHVTCSKDAITTEPISTTDVTDAPQPAGEQATICSMPVQETAQPLTGLVASHLKAAQPERTHSTTATISSAGTALQSLAVLAEGADQSAVTDVITTTAEDKGSDVLLLKI